MHGSAIVAEGKVSVSEPVSKFEGAGLSRKIGDGGAEGLGHGAAGFDICRPAQENGLKGVGFLEVANDGGERGGVPPFGGSVGGAGENGEVGLGRGVLGFGESGGWGKFGFAFGKSEILQQAEVLVGHVDVAVGSGAAGTIFGE